LTLGGDPYDDGLRLITRGACCGNPAIGECLTCAIVYHDAGTLWTPHKGVTYRVVPIPLGDDGPFPRICPACTKNNHDGCLRRWTISADASPHPLKYFCGCQLSHPQAEDIDWGALVVRNDETPPPNE
jgi:hypothetical protein